MGNPLNALPRNSLLFSGFFAVALGCSWLFAFVLAAAELRMAADMPLLESLIIVAGTP